MKEKYYGLFPGRHDLPEVSGYVFPAVVDPTDFDAMEHHVREFLIREAGITTSYDIPLNGAGDETLVYKGRRNKMRRKIVRSHKHTVPISCIRGALRVAIDSNNSIIEDDCFTADVDLFPELDVDFEF